MRFLLALFCIASLTVAGCSNSIPGDETKGGKAESGQTDTSDNSGGNSLAGKWLMIASRMDAPLEDQLAIIEIEKDDEGEFTGKVIASSEERFPNAAIGELKVSEKTIQVLFDLGRGRLDVHGTLDGDTIYGNAPTNIGLQPVRLVRAKQDSVGGPESVPTEGAKEFQAAREDKDSVKSLREFARKFEKSPTALSAYLSLLANSKENELKENVVAEIIDNFTKTARRWGPRMERNVRLDAASILVQKKHLPELAMKTLVPLEKAIDEEDDEFLSRLNLTSAMAQVISSNPATRKAGAKALQTLHKADLFNHRLRVALAKHHNKNGDKQAALQLFAELSALPDGDAYLRALSDETGDEPETAAQATKRLWKSIHGEDEGLDEFRDTAYEKVLKQMFQSESKSAPANAAGKQVSLCELFTGSACPPCVAADIATVGLEATYPRSNLIVLRYHQHIPLPDPLANADAETRFAYYEAQGTPAVMLNGRQVEGIAGPFAYSRYMYDQLLERVVQVIDADSKLAIKLTADAKDGNIAITASVDGAKELPPASRLRLVLAEDVVNFDARNGVRRHEMVVRYMPGGPDGITLEQGKLAYDGTLKLSDIKQAITDYLDRIAKQFENVEQLPPQLLQQMPNGPFPVRPMTLKPLHLVALVQDDATKEIFQAAAIPVTGELLYPGETEAAGPSLTPPAPTINDPNAPVLAPIPQ